METKENKIEAIRRACIEANESILALEFGCEVKRYNSIFTWIHISCMSDGLNLCTYLNRETNVIHSVRETLEGVEKFEIIGRPIRLADVLVAIGDLSNEAVVLDTKGRITDIKTATSNGFHGAVSWNLLLDDLTLQSEETITFIHSLLKERE